jgi:3-methyladenine DNA glycosylase AlkD
MAAYMRDQFPFLGVPTPERRRAARAVLAELPMPTEIDLIGLSSALYGLPEREYHYIAVDYIAANIRRCSGTFLSHARVLITTKSWWDTVDGLAAAVVGPLVLEHPELQSELDTWIDDENIWVARTAILHQLRYKSRTDEARLFRYCELQARHRDFFIRKAIGWALREYSKTNPGAVRSFIETHDATLSGLSKREGMLWITGRKKRSV